MKKTLIILLMFLIGFIADAQDKMEVTPSTYEDFKREMLNLDVEPVKSIKLEKVSKQSERRYVIMGVVAFVGIMTLSKYGSEQNSLTDNAYYITCGVITTGTLIYCFSNKKSNWESKRRRR